MRAEAIPAPKKGFTWLFFVLTFAFSWALWIPFVISGKEVSLLAVAGGAFSPSIVGAILASASRDRGSRRDFWKRVYSFRRIGGAWYAVIFLAFPVLIGLTLLVDYFIGGRFFSLQAAVRTLSQPVALAVFIVQMIVGGPLAEELGWRGFALDRLQSRWTALGSSLLLGAIWGLWHLPLFFMKGTTQGEMGLLSLRFWLFFIQVLPLAVLFTWVYNNNGRSTLSAILMHFMTNSTITLIVEIRHALPERIEIIRTAIFVLAALVVVLFWGPKTLIRKGQETRAG
jgi:uncharacterized protein